MMDERRLVSKIRIHASAQRVWRELTKSDEPQAAVFNAWLHAQAMLPGAVIQMRTIDGKNVLVVGRIVEFDPPRRFAHTFRFTQYDDPECTVIYELAAAEENVEVTLTVGHLLAGTRTAKDMDKGAKLILETLKSVAETGRPKFSTRLMYAMFAKLGFVLPKRTRAEHWPLPSTERSR